MRIIRSLRLLLLELALLSVSSFAQVAVLVSFGPPAIPVYEQPLCPGEGYIWVPGYWAYDYDFGDYYWVPGTWVLAPEVGLLWTPGYWAWNGDGFAFYDGYWAPRVGFYGGIVYGFGYFGRGYVGGRWDGGRFFYNRAVNNVNVMNIHNVYNETVINNVTVNRVSYNGGDGGVNVRPTPEEEAVAGARHIAPVPDQTQHVRAARSNPQLRASANLGRPPVAATPRPAALNDRAVVAAREAGAPYRPPPNRGGTRPVENPETRNPENGASRPGRAIHPRDLPSAPPLSDPNTGNPKLDQKYQQQQEKLRAKQDREVQKLQQRQDQDHQQMEQRKSDEARRQRTEQGHQQQTQQLEQRHTQQQQKMQEKQMPRGRNQAPPPQERPQG